MNEVTELKGNRDIETVEICRGIHAYKDTILIEGEIHSTTEGIATIEAINDRKGIKPINGRTGEHNDWYIILPRGFVEKWKLGTENDIKSANYIKLPYASYINAPEDYDLVVWSHYDGNLYDLDGKVYPKAIRFSYMGGSVTNERYYLKKLREYVLSCPDKFVNVSEIKSIPSYNASETSNKEVAFTWIPTQAEYEQIYKGDCLMRDWNSLKFLGFDQFRKPEIEED